jgi:hypothetical protein
MKEHLFNAMLMIHKSLKSNINSNYASKYECIIYFNEW